ncbi:unnamed protein product [Lepeophtheirus salmonis]|uniref:(salmon louse) hypothetical protein n=1 Tax=Lepeophtheirus salmonis TaxID=72036 RepID=A0A7R8HD75_LEPSM|nr:unnamed protein product [Lepeophtheirus salmonis]CAF3017709.1 unnamed protein product [Lepeophtheirus salmonis]
MVGTCRRKCSVLGRTCYFLAVVDIKGWENLVIKVTFLHLTILRYPRVERCNKAIIINRSGVFRYWLPFQVVILMIHLFEEKEGTLKDPLGAGNANGWSEKLGDEVLSGPLEAVPGRQEGLPGISSVSPGRVLFLLVLRGSEGKSGWSPRGCGSQHPM